MSTQSVISNYFNILSGNSEGNFIDCLSPNIVWNLSPHHPFGGSFQGIDDVLQMLAKGLPIFDQETLKFDIHCVVTEGENAFAHFTMTGKTSKGKDYSNQYLFRFRVQNDQIVELWESMDTLYMDRLGMYTP